MGLISGETLKISQISFLKKFSLEQLFSICQAKGFACAIYRLPEDNVKHLIIDVSGGQNLDHLHLDEMGSGYIFHPFSSEHHPIKFIRRDIHILEQSESKTLDIFHTEMNAEELNELFDSYEIHESQQPKTSNANVGEAAANCESRYKFIDLINKTIHKIKDNKFQKAVISRCKTINLPDQFSATEFFTSLYEHYGNAFVHLSFIPGIGTWIGATPETLINIDRNRQFQTVALAATQACLPNDDLEETTWSQKDIEEQAMVSRYIINCFKKIRLREFEEIGPRTYFSGNLVHLKTDYKVDMDQIAFPQLGTIMLELLHPTSAICGMPREPSQEFILNNEGFDREYFSGFLGPVNVLEETNIFVNLRCMKLMPSNATLFAGAGIIANSNPEKEWNETEIKMNTLLKVMKELY